MLNIQFLNVHNLFFKKWIIQTCLHCFFDKEPYHIWFTTGFHSVFFLQEVVSLQNQAPPSTAPVAAPVAAPGAAVVKITGIPASMTGSSIFDCLQQLLGEFTHTEISPYFINENFELTWVNQVSQQFHQSKWRFKKKHWVFTNETDVHWIDFTDSVSVGI